MVDGYQPLTDSQWQVMQPLLPVHGNRRLCLRQVLDAVRYVCRTGCQWRALPAGFPAWTAVYYYFRRWQPVVWARLNEALNRADRLAADRAATPSLVCVDSQSAKLAPRIFEHRGTDGGKHVNGRKRQIITDVEGRIFACYVHAANGHDGTAATQGLLPQRPAWGQRLVTVLTDNGYRGGFAAHLQALGLRHELASRPPSVRGFVPVAKRWVVERTFAWLACFRRLAVDYEFTPASHQAWLLIANSTMCLNRICPN
ncbi:IS5 family transposase [Hymenobacter armeniacus]|nr:IS5 family transposase [Hymenobacter armeniacus]